ncbi:MAG: CPBP family intramembrane metalloprotease [Chloroflexi bacterium]|nr:CPBP family intramembrane metalloprotease [Chloroflexota bacterium]
MSYLDVAQQGKNQWWRFLIAVPFILFVWLIVGSLPLVAAVIILKADGNPATDVDLNTGQLIGVDPLWSFLLLMISFVIFLVGVIIAVILIHRRPPRTLITAASAVNWKRVGQGFLVWGLLAAAMSAVESILYPGRYQLEFDLARFIPFAIASVILIPIQTTAEEFFFRGYLLQGFGLLIKNPVVLSLLSGFLFMLPHLANPEVAVNFWLLVLFYFSFGTFLAWVSLKDNSLELALGVHAGNNLFTALFANYKGGALITPAVFTVGELDAVYNLVGSLVSIGLFYLWFFGPFRPKN